MTAIGIQLYALREIDAPVAAVIDRVGETALRGVELYTLDDPSAVRAALDRTALTVAGAHVAFGALETDREATLDRWTGIGVDRVVVPWADPTHFRDRDAVEALADRLTDLADHLAERGCTLHYHNHAHELDRIGTESGLAALAATTPASTVRFELDLGWIGVAGRDPTAALNRYRDRIDLVHLKDYADGAPTALGTGELAIDAVLGRAAAVGVDWVLCEEEAAGDAAALDRAAAVARRHG